MQSLRDSFGYVRQEKVITTFLLVSSIFNIFGRSFVILLPVFAKEVLRIGASGLGFIAGGPGLGTIIGSFCLAALGRVEADGEFSLRYYWLFRPVSLSSRRAATFGSRLHAL